jgi:hypothetical protein
MLTQRLQFQRISLFSLNHLRVVLKNQGLVLLTNFHIPRKHLQYGVTLKSLKSATKFAPSMIGFNFTAKIFQSKHDQPIRITGFLDFVHRPETGSVSILR